MNIMSKSNASKKPRKLAHCLPIIGAVREGVYNPGSIEVLSLAKPDTILARTKYGMERILYQDAQLIVCTGQYFIRYLQTSLPENEEGSSRSSATSWHDDICLASLILRIKSPTCHTLDNIYVDSAYRCRGIATSLIERAYRDFPDLCLDGRFSAAGIHFFGVSQKKRR